MIMKNIKKLIFSLALIGFAGCSEFLEEQAFDTYTTDNFPVSEADAEALVNQMYREAGQIYGNRYLWLSELPSEMVTTRTSGSDRRAQLDDYTVVNTNDYNEGFWNDSYQTVKQANAVIAFYEGGESSINPDLASRLVAESKVIRANTYFNLATFFGDVPLILERITNLAGTANPITDLSQVYDAIIQDLIEAEPDLPFVYEQVDDFGRVTRGAARALLGKVYLQRGAEPRDNIGSPQDFQEALKWLRLVRDNDGGTNYSLEPKFDNLFGLDKLESSKLSNEIVFQLWRDAANCCDNQVHQHLVARDAPYGGVRWGNLVGEVPFYLSYEDTDERFQVTFLDTIVTPTKTYIYDVDNPGTDGFQHDGPPFQKWVDINSPDSGGGNNIFLIRYSDVLLMIAEALNEINNGPDQEAYDAINQVRSRARTVPGMLQDYEGLTYDQFRTAVYNERRWELAFEGHGLRDGHRFLNIFESRVEAAPAYVQPPVPEGVKPDGGRRNDAVPDRPIDVNLENIRFPIPLSEIDANSEIEE
jgi:hypothetical protein